MDCYLYMSLTPESLIASALDPREFGLYFATGQKRRSRSQALFFSVNASFLGDEFPLKEIERRGIQHRDGLPRRSLYLSIYRVLERVPSEALGTLYLTTQNGQVLGLKKGKLPVCETRGMRLYQELCPIMPLVTSRLTPLDYGSSITSPRRVVNVPRLVFCELELGALGEDAEVEMVGDLPYPNIQHLRDCLKELRTKPHKENKTVHRGMNSELHYRTVKKGFYVSDPKGTIFYPLPEIEKLETEHLSWWKSAQDVN